MKQIKYEVDNGICLTPCPYKQELSNEAPCYAMVSSLVCTHSCLYFVKDDKINKCLECAYED